MRGGQIGRFSTLHMSVMLSLLAGDEEYRWRPFPINSLSLSLFVSFALSLSRSLSGSQLLSRALGGDPPGKRRGYRRVYYGVTAAADATRKSESNVLFSCFVWRKTEVGGTRGVNPPPL
jgi:hypothetical protein